MEFNLPDLSAFGLDMGAVLATLIVTSIFKALDRKNRFKAGYVLFPLMAALLICGLEEGWELRHWLLESFKTAAASAYMYDVYRRAIRPGRKSKPVEGGES